MLALVSGASGAGKTVVCGALRSRWSDIELIDSDQHPHVDEPRLAQLERIVREAVQRQAGGVATVVFGQSPLGELLACASAIEIDKIAAFLLDCGDVVRIDRVRARQADTDWFNHDHLCWAAWHRVHAIDPQWSQHTIVQGLAYWDRWTSWTRGDARWRVHRLDTDGRSIDAVAAELAERIEHSRQHPSSLSKSATWWRS